MSNIKRLLEEQEARGFGETLKNVCGSCLPDPALASTIIDSAEDQPCSYCGEAPSAPLDEVLSHILEALRAEYRPWSEENPGWDQEDKTYTVPDFWLPDLIFDHMQGDWHPAIEDDITGAVVDAEPWFERDAYVLRPHEQLMLSWRRFAAVLERRRSREKRPTSRPSRDPDERISTEATLDAIGAELLEFPAAFGTMPARTRMWRARNGDHHTVAGLGPLPADRRGPDGRMSPAGVNWFYGTSDRDTALLEKNRPGVDPMSVGTFSTVRPVVVLDLTGEGLPVPSIFDLGAQRGRVAAFFLAEFAAEISKPVRSSASPRYYPTQVVTEYIRTELVSPDGDPIEGILYPSTRGPGINVVLFHGADACVQGSVRRRARHRLRMVSSELVSRREIQRIRNMWQRRTAGIGSRRPAAWSRW